MKIKKQRESIAQAFKTIADKDINVVPTMLTLDVSGNLTIDGNGKFLNYDSGMISVNTQGKTIYIYGEELKITSYSKAGIYISGNIHSIEIFEVK